MHLTCGHDLHAETPGITVLQLLQKLSCEFSPFFCDNFLFLYPTEIVIHTKHCNPHKRRAFPGVANLWIKRRTKSTNDACEDRKLCMETFSHAVTMNVFCTKRRTKRPSFQKNCRKDWRSRFFFYFLDNKCVRSLRVQKSAKNMSPCKIALVIRAYVFVFMQQNAEIECLPNTRCKRFHFISLEMRSAWTPGI